MHSKNTTPTPSRPWRRFVRLSRRSRACTSRKPEDRTLRQRAGVLQERQEQKKDVCERISAEGEAASGEAGQSRGVVRAPRRSQLPAVRAVSEICEGVVERAKIALLGSRFEKSLPFQGKRRGCTKKCVEIEQISAGTAVVEATLSLQRKAACRSKNLQAAF